MQQSPTVLLDYKKPESSGAVGYWVHTGEGGKETKYVRVICGLSVPSLDRQAAAVIAIGELMRSFAPMDLTGLAAAVGSWPEIRNALLGFCRDLKPSDIITENKESQKLVWPVTDKLVGTEPLPLSAVAPAHSLTELGRQNVELLITEDRLHIEHLLPVLEQEKDSANDALRLAVNYCLDFTAFYPGKKRPQPKYGRLLGEF